MYSPSLIDLSWSDIVFPCVLPFLSVQVRYWYGTVLLTSVVNRNFMAWSDPDLRPDSHILSSLKCVPIRGIILPDQTLLT
jgi:hypothetical protein